MEMEVFKENIMGQIVTKGGGRKPVYMASMETTDPSVVALADILFWTDIFEEHAKFMEMLMPVEDLAQQREQAVIFRGIFRSLHDQAKNTDLSADDIRKLSDMVVMHAKELRDFKRQIEDMQKRGQIHSLLWTTFLDHIAREDERFMDRQMRLMRGDTAFDREEIIDFWSQIMTEHASFIAHLLDPAEVDLINQALDQSIKFQGIKREHALEANVDPVPFDVDHFVDFKTAALQGIEAAEVASIITPDLADHVRREAVLFSHELKKADMMMNVQPKAA